MSETMEDLARRAVASPHWRWLPGMLEVGGMRAVGEEGRGGIFWVDYCSGCYVSTAGRLPDLDDAATLGCLLALVREAWGCPVWLSLDADPEPLDGDETVVCGSERWTACRVGGGLGAQPCGSGPIGAAALVAALEAAPTPEER